MCWKHLFSIYFQILFVLIIFVSFVFKRKLFIRIFSFFFVNYFSFQQTFFYVIPCFCVKCFLHFICWTLLLLLCHVTVGTRLVFPLSFLYWALFALLRDVCKPWVTMSCACNTGKDNTGWYRVKTWMLWRERERDSFVWLDADGCPEMRSWDQQVLWQHAQCVQCQYCDTFRVTTPMSTCWRHERNLAGNNT